MGGGGGVSFSSHFEILKQMEPPIKTELKYDHQSSSYVGRRLSSIGFDNSGIGLFVVIGNSYSDMLGPHRSLEKSTMYYCKKPVTLRTHYSSNAFSCYTLSAWKK